MEPVVEIIFEPVTETTMKETEIAKQRASGIWAIYNPNKVIIYFILFIILINFYPTSKLRRKRTNNFRNRPLTGKHKKL